MSDLEFDWEQHAINLEAELAKVSAERDVWLNCFKLTEPETEKLKVERDQLAAEKAALLNLLDDAVHQREYWETKCHKDTAQLRHEKAALERERDELKNEVAKVNQFRETLHGRHERVKNDLAVVTDERDALNAQLAEARGHVKRVFNDFTPNHAAALAQNEKLREALEEITEGKGAFSRDPLTHAANCIESMKATARAALAQEQP